MVVTMVAGRVKENDTYSLFMNEMRKYLNFCTSCLGFPFALDGHVNRLCDAFNNVPIGYGSSSDIPSIEPGVSSTSQGMSHLSGYLFATARLDYKNPIGMYGKNLSYLRPGVLNVFLFAAEP
ncbi:hypothetical protein Tco_1001262 [Tanacetum coccineum]